MRSRHIISLLCAGLAALGCRSHAHKESITARPEVNAITASLNVRAAEKDVRFALHLMNTGKKNLEVNFPNGQSYDFAVVDSLGREVWRWGRGRMFTQTLRNKFLDGGASFDVAERWSALPPPGRYTAIATLTSSNYPVVERVDFTVP